MANQKVLDETARKSEPNIILKGIEEFTAYQNFPRYERESPVRLALIEEESIDQYEIRSTAY